CWCSATGNYRAAVGGDCDDNPAACGAACHPNGTEICDTYDNDCDGTVDNAPQNASGCTTSYLDADNDTYGVTGNTQCWFSATGTFPVDVSGAATCSSFAPGDLGAVVMPLTVQSTCSNTITALTINRHPLSNTPDATFSGVSLVLDADNSGTVNAGDTTLAGPV